MDKKFLLKMYRFIFCIFISCISSVTLASSLNKFSSLDVSGQSSFQKILSNDGDDILPAKEAFKLNYFINGSEVNLRWEMPQGYYLYYDKFKITEIKQEKVLNLEFGDEPEVVEDPIFGSVKVFHGNAFGKVEVPQNASGEVNLSVEFQGCASGRLCYPPEKRQISVVVEDLSADQNGLNSIVTSGLYAKSSDEIDLREKETEKLKEDGVSGSMIDKDAVNWFGANASELSAQLFEMNRGLIVIVFFVLGLALTFTPCVLPMIPIVSALVLGSGAKTSTHRAFMLSLSYVMGMSLAYTAVGVAVGTLGASWNLQGAFQSPTALGVISGIFILLAFAMFGLFDLKLPSIFYRLGGKSEGGSLRGGFLVGAVSAIAVSPCVSAPLAGALIYLSSTGDILTSGLALFALSIGMGIPLILTGTFGRSILPKAGEWMLFVRNMFGFLLLAMGAWLISRLLPDPLMMLVWGVWGASLSAMLLIWAGRIERLSVLVRVTGLIVGLWSAFVLAGAASGSDNQSITSPLKVFVYSEKESGPERESVFEVVKSRDELDQILGQGMPVMVDVYADWCVSCLVMEQEVFSTQSVLDLKSEFRFVKFDISDFTKEHKAFLDQHDVFGPPAVIFFDRKGKLVQEGTLQGETDLEGFMRHLENKVLPE